jgi:hypothetical protein
MRFSITTALAFALFGPALASPGVSPASVTKTGDPGYSFNVDKVVTTPEIPPKPDVVLLVDVTGSMGPTIANIKTNLDKVISSVTGTQPNARFAVASFGDFADPNRFQVNQPLTNNVAALQAAVDSLKPEGGGDAPEDWINALYQLSMGAVSFGNDSSRIIVLVSDENSHDPSGGHTLSDAIKALQGHVIRVIGVNVANLDLTGQASAVTTATGGVIVSSDANAVTKAIISGLKNLDVTVKPDVVSCDAGLTVHFSPTQTLVSSGAVATFLETATIASGASQGVLHCSVRFLLNGTPGGNAFDQSIAVTVKKVTKPCATCVPSPGQNLCHITTSCAPTPYGTMCLTRPGYKADGAADNDTTVQWRLNWPAPGQEHRVAVKPGTSADTLCNPKFTGPDVCKEVSVAACSAEAFEGARYDTPQEVLGVGEL